MNIDNEDEDPYDFLMDPEMLSYIESLRDKFSLDEDLDPKEFIYKIEMEIETGNITDKQHFALEELKKGLLLEMLEPLQIEVDIDTEDIDSEEDEEAYYLNDQIQKEKFSPRFKDDTNEDGKEEYFQININDPHSQIFKGRSQAEIVDEIKTQYYFNAQNNPKIKRINSIESEQDSKENTSKTP